METAGEATPQAAALEECAPPKPPDAVRAGGGVNAGRKALALAAEVPLALGEAPTTAGELERPGMAATSDFRRAAEPARSTLEFTKRWDDGS